MSRRTVILIVIVVAAVIAGLLYWRVSATEQKKRGNADEADTPIPVTVVAATTADVPQVVTALGTVEALNTVTIGAQISGQLQSLEFKEGGEVKKNDLIAVIDPRTYQSALDQASAKKKQDEAQLSASASTLKRYEDLIQKNFVAAQDLENQRQTVRQQQALVAADEAAISTARTQLSYTRIVSPIDGLAGIRQIDVGNLVQANGTSIVVLTQTRPISVIFTLPQQDMERVRSAQIAAATDAPLMVTAISRNDATPISSGTLSVIDNTIDSTTATFKLKATFPNEDRKLWPGEFVNVRLQLHIAKDAIVVPATGVQQGPDGEFVYLLKPDNKVAVQPVKSGGVVDGGKVMVDSGLKVGDKIVTEGQFRLKPDSTVEPLAPGEVPAAKPVPDGQRKRRGGRSAGG
ncbi:MAG: efflux RND transporter periplasmic adaptor subunit [Dokdonella sp.]